MSVGQAFAHMPKLTGFLVCGSAAFLGDSNCPKFYDNFTAMDEDKDTCAEKAIMSALEKSHANRLDMISKQNSAVVASNIYRLRMQQAASKAEGASRRSRA